MHLNAFGGRALPGHAGRAYRPIYLLAGLRRRRRGVGKKKGREGMGERREGKKKRGGSSPNV